MTFLKAAIAVYMACQAWDVQPPARCVNELWDCTSEFSVEHCQEKILDKYEPKEDRATRYADVYRDR